MKLEFIDLKKSYGDREVLHGLNFTVHSGRAMAFLGRNGAGKTTTIRTLMGVFPPSSGKILLNGEPIEPYQLNIGYLPEERGLYSKDKVLRQLIFFGMLRGFSKEETERSARELIAKVGLSDYLDTPLENLSKGNQQKVQICEALLNDPDLLILDEPFSGLDPVNAQILMDLIKDFTTKDKLVLFSSHQMNYVAEICQDIAIIHQGEIVLSGSLEQARAKLGEGKLLVRPKHIAPEDLCQVITELVPSAQCDLIGGSILAKIPEDAQKTFLASLVGTGVELESFMPYMPSVSDVFIHYVGEEEKKDE